MGARLAVPLIERRHLLDRLDPRRALIVLRAPAGYGKSTLAAEWLRKRVGPTAVTARMRPPLGGMDGFWPAVADALEQAGLPVAGLDELPAHAAVERALQLDGPPVYLAVDDVDNVNDRSLDEALVELLRAAPRLHLLACVRHRERMHSRWSGELDTTTLTATDLLFTSDETVELARAIAGDSLPTAVAELVHRECGGWPTLTRAVLVELAGRPSSAFADRAVAAAVDEIAGEFLRERLRHEPRAEELLEFALATAPAELLTDSLAAALTGDPAAKAHLEAWVDAGVLLVESRHGSRNYWWPAAARRLFVSELAARPAERVADVHARLAEAYLDDHPAWALTHAVQAQRWAFAVRVIDTCWRALLVNHRDRLYQAITDIPLAMLRPSRRAIAMRDVMLQVSPADMLSRDVLPPDDDSIELLARTENAPDELDVALAVLVAFRNCAPPADAREVAVRVLRFARATRVLHPSAAAGPYPAVVAQVGAAMLAAGDRAGAVDAYQEVFRRAHEGTFDYLARDAASKLALVHALDGDLGRSEAWLQRYEKAPPPSTWLTTYFESAAASAKLLCAMDRLDIAAAAAAAQRLTPAVFPDPFRGTYLYGRALLALHDGRAADLLDELDELVAERPHEAAPLAAARADLLLALGRGNQARAILQGPLREHWALRLGQARLALLTGDHASALRYAQDPQWERQAGTRSRQEMRLVRAVAAFRAGEEGEASRSLHRIVEAARATGALRPLVTVARDELRAMAHGRPAVQELLDLDALARHPDVFPVHVPVATLTRREQLVLEKLASGLTLQQTADALVVSYNTIRSQQASIYHKLGVDSRADAIARAREWSLL